MEDGEDVQEDSDCEIRCTNGNEGESRGVQDSLKTSWGMKEGVGGYGEKERVFEMTMNVSSMELNVF